MKWITMFPKFFLLKVFYLLYSKFIDIDEWLDMKHSDLIMQYIKWDTKKN